MQMVKKSAFIGFAIWLLIVILMPKAEIYYKIEEELAKHDIKLNEKSIKETPFGLTLEDVTVYVKGIALANIEELHFFTLLFYNSLEVQELQIDEALHGQVPAKTQKAVLRQNIFLPLSISVDANGSFGVIEGDIDLLDKKVHIDFIELKEIQMIQSSLQKNEKGWFYEKSF